MNPLVLLRVVAALDRALVGARLREVRQDGPDRFRLGFEDGDGRASIAISLRPGAPWIARPRWRAERGHGAGSPFAARCTRALRGVALSGIRQAGADRLVRLCFGEAGDLVAELPDHGSNLILLDARGRVVATARQPRRARERQRPGGEYSAPGLPSRLLDPFEADAAAIDARLEAAVAAGSTLEQALRREVFGLGGEGIELVLAERRSGATAGEIVTRRVAELRAGRAEPVLDGPPGLLEEILGTVGLRDGRSRLWPWEPEGPPATDLVRYRDADAARLAGLYHDALERGREVRERGAALATLARGERRRMVSALGQARADLEGFADPDGHRLDGEALLAGATRARRDGAFVRVPDPYGPPGAVRRVPVEPGVAPAAAAESCFARHRRALRGRERARERVAELERRLEDLDAALERHPAPEDAAAVAALESALQACGLPIGLEPDTRAGRARRRRSPPRLEGVRVLTSRGGESILVGKGARGNDRLTFRLASPEDLWFHALGLPGAHVVVRDPGRKPAEALLREAAAAAAWYSDGRDQARVDVQWTRRKYVRRRRGGPAGAVLIKKFQTLRVRPGLPPEPTSGKTGSGPAPGGPSFARNGPS